MKKSNQITKEKITEFKIDTNVIHHLIYSQSADLHRAIIELIQNSIDSESTDISITFQDSKENLISPENYLVGEVLFKLVDNGSGLKTTEEFVNNLGVFGLKKERSLQNKFGKFGMGRGQILRFGAIEWASNDKVFSVDLKEDGLGYKLSDCLPGKEIINGCVVSGRIEQPEQYLSLRDLVKKLIEQLQFIDTETRITLNGVSINDNPRNQVLDHELYSLYDLSPHLDYNISQKLHIYNMGVYVTSIDHYLTGHLVTKQHLDLNTSRDKILSSCRLWDSIWSHTLTYSCEEITKQTKINGPQLRRFIYSIERSFIPFDHIFSKKIFSKFQTTHRKYSIADLANNEFPIIVLGTEEIKDRTVVRIVDRIMQSKQPVLVINIDPFEDSEDFIKQLKSSKTQISKQVLAKIKDYNDYKYLLNTGDDVISDENIKEPSVLFTLYSIRDVYKKLLKLLGPRKSYFYSQLEEQWYQRSLPGPIHESFLHPREIVLGNLETNILGNTDGESVIRIDYNYLKSQSLSSSGLENLILLIIHELSHNVEFGTADEHNHAFYQTYHDITSHVSINKLVEYAKERTICNYLKRTVPLDNNRFLSSFSPSSESTNSIIASLRQLNKLTEITKKIKRFSKKDFYIKSAPYRDSIIKSAFSLMKQNLIIQTESYYQSYHKEYFYHSVIRSDSKTNQTTHDILKYTFELINEESRENDVIQKMESAYGNYFYYRVEGFCFFLSSKIESKETHFFLWSESVKWPKFLRHYAWS